MLAEASYSSQSTASKPNTSFGQNRMERRRCVLLIQACGMTVKMSSILMPFYKALTVAFAFQRKRWSRVF